MPDVYVCPVTDASPTASEAPERPARRYPPLRWPHNFSFRGTDEMKIIVEDLRTVVDGQVLGEAFRWLLTDPVVLERIKAKIKGEIE